MKKILVIDDDDQFNKMLCMILTEAGYQALSAHDGDSGIKTFHREAPVLVITDIFMPKKEGLETIMELRTIDPEVKILVMSGGISQMSLTETFNLAGMFGANAVLAKPFDINTFTNTVNSLLSASSAHNAEDVTNMAI